MNTQVLLNNEAFMKAIVNADTIEELKELFEEQGIDASEEDIRSALKMIVNSGSTEHTLSEAELDSVAGGITVTGCYAVLNAAMIMIAGKPIHQLAELLFFK